MIITIDRFEHDHAVLRVEGHREYLLPVAMIPTGAKVGDVVTLSIDTPDARAQTAKDILNEILEEE